MNVQSAITAIGGRRYLLVLLTGAGTTALQWVGKLDPAGRMHRPSRAMRCRRSPPT
jgi:hypothetical protein